MDLEKTNALVNLKNYYSDAQKVYLYAKDPFEAKDQFLIRKREIVGLKEYNDSKALIEYLNNIDYIYENIEEYSPCARA